MHTRRTAVAVGATTALTLTFGAAVTTAGPALGDPRSSACRLVELPPPPGGFDAGVMDIEVVNGTTIYYGNYQVVEDGVQTQRAVIWRGIDGAPEPIDTGLGMFTDIAYELTSTGLVNGRSETREGGWRGAVSWVLDLRTMTLTTLPGRGGAADDTTMLARRVNDAGALVGTDINGRGAGSDRRNGLLALGWARPSSPAVRLRPPVPAPTASASMRTETAAASSRSRSWRASPTGRHTTRPCGAPTAR